MSEAVIIYTDGSARGNPGPGGYGAILMFGDHRKELAQGYRRTTNNRMELMAVIAALKTLKRPGFRVTIYSDSQYVVRAVSEGGWRIGSGPNSREEKRIAIYGKNTTSSPKRIRSDFIG